MNYSELVCDILTRIGYERFEDSKGIVLVHPDDTEDARNLQSSTDPNYIWGLRPDRAILDGMTVPQMDIPKLLLQYREGCLDHMIIMARLEGRITEDECIAFKRLEQEKLAAFGARVDAYRAVHPGGATLGLKHLKDVGHLDLVDVSEFH